MLTQPVKIILFGGLKIELDGRLISRFRTQKTAALLAYLAYNCHNGSRMYPREELIDLFWPESDLNAGRISLRTAISSLRSQLEPPGVASNTVLQADRIYIRLNPEAIVTDVSQFDSAVRSARITGLNAEARARILERAVSFYAGELLPGHYEDWVATERERLCETLIGVLIELAQIENVAGNRETAVNYLVRAVALDPIREQTHRTLMKVYADAGNIQAAVRQFAALEKALQEFLMAEPEDESRDLLQAITSIHNTTTSPALKPSQEASDEFQAPVASSETRDAGLNSAPYESTGAVPFTFNRFFGREHEVDLLMSHLKPTVPVRKSQSAQGRARLVTLVGMGGAGKTRTAISVCQQMLPVFRGRVWFVPLADVTDPHFLPTQIMSVLKITNAGTVAADDLISEALSGDPSLLVLDNFEQLIAEPTSSGFGPQWLKSLLARTKELRVLVTSRQVLGVEGEVEVGLRPLLAPSSKGTPETILEFPSVQLFVDRAQSVKPDFQITQRNVDAIGAICLRLEGIPLALELTAAWARTLTPSQILERLDRRFELLISRRRDVEDRHATLRGAIDWSRRLLEPALQKFFASLSVFSGGWGIDEASEVCGRQVCLDYTARLIECSLITMDTTPEGSGVARYRMLDTLREYAREILKPDEWEALMLRHATWCVQLAEDGDKFQAGPQAGAWMERLETEQDNMRAALDRLIACSNSQSHAASVCADLAIRMVGALWRYWHLRGRGIEGSEWMRRVLELPSDRTDDTWLTARAKALTGAANLCYTQGYVQRAREFHVESLQIRRKLGQADGIIASISNLGNLAMDQGDLAAARELQDEAVQLARSTGNLVRLSAALNNLANVASRQRDYTSARKFLEECLDIKRNLADVSGVGTALTNLGDVAYRQKEYDRAIMLHTEGLAHKRSVGDRLGQAICLIDLGFVYLDLAKTSEARAYFEESLLLFRRMGHRQGIACGLEGIGRLRLAEGETEEAVRLICAAKALRTRIDFPYTEQEQQECEEALRAAQVLIGSSKYFKAVLRGEQMEMEEAIRDALGPEVDTAGAIL